MAAATVHSVIPGWAGDRRRQQVILTLASTDADTLDPGAVGLKEIEAVVPTNRAGSLGGRDGAVADVVAITSCSYTPSTDVLAASGASKFEAYIFGY